MKKSVGLILVGVALVLTLQWGWNQVHSDAVAEGQPVREIWATSGTPKWEESEAVMNTLWADGYRVVGYNVTLNKKDELIKHIVMSR